MKSISYTVRSLEDLKPVVKQMIKMIREQRIWAFVGEMGAGKTTLIKELCTQLGVPPNEVNSPTFAIVNEYQGTLEKTIYHFDFYRIKSEEEAFDLGYEEYFYSGALCFVEWPQKVASLMPDQCAIVRIVMEDEFTRVIRIDVE